MSVLSCANINLICTHLFQMHNGAYLLKVYLIGRKCKNVWPPKSAYSVKKVKMSTKNDARKNDLELTAIFVKCPVALKQFVLKQQVLRRFAQDIQTCHFRRGKISVVLSKLPVIWYGPLLCL